MLRFLSILPHLCAQGNRMGWGFVAFGFGLSFGFVITSEFKREVAPFCD